MIKISIIASSVRPWLWDEFFQYLINTHDIEVIFSGNLSTFQVRPYLDKYSILKYIHTSDCISPAQCYEISRRFSYGELIHWSCDDSSYINISLDHVYSFYKQLPSKSLISIKTREDNMETELDDHRFFGFNRQSPLMAPLGVINREYLQSLGGFDRRYLAGQWENQVALRVYENGGQIIKYEKGHINIEHLKKHGRGTRFWKAYEGDREILESEYAIGPRMPPPKSDNNYGVHVKLNGFQPPTVTWPRWIDTRKVSVKSQTGFFPYSDVDLTTVSQCPNRKWPPDESI